jgi:hypothetical protein
VSQLDGAAQAPGKAAEIFCVGLIRGSNFAVDFCQKGADASLQTAAEIGDQVAGDLFDEPGYFIGVFATGFIDAVQ